MLFVLILVAIAFQLMYGFVKDAALDWTGLATLCVVYVFFFVSRRSRSLYVHSIRLLLMDELPEHLKDVIRAHRMMWTRLGISAILSTIISILTTIALLYSEYFANQADF